MTKAQVKVLLDELETDLKSHTRKIERNNSWGDCSVHYDEYIGLSTLHCALWRLKKKHGIKQ